ncbi:MAG: type III-B CRISPR module-associated Cmr3 family protein [Verrucomicrobiales bacterium]
MNIILLQPTDVLFFRDGRPMEGSLSGHGSAWPMPSVINQALHAALHRADFAEDPHKHRIGRQGIYQEEGERKFGCLTTAGPFPIRNKADWFFPRPLDLLTKDLSPALRPLANHALKEQSSLPAPAQYAVANSLSPSKDHPAKSWLSGEGYRKYLKGERFCDDQEAEKYWKNDKDFADVEHSVGIGIDPETETTGQNSAAGQIYSAHYLRLRDGEDGRWSLGVLAEAVENAVGGKNKRDLIEELINGSQKTILVGGQQRTCNAERITTSGALPLPLGLHERFPERNGKYLVKWVLLSPAIWPAMTPGESRRETETGPKTRRNPHPGGWLPNWIEPTEGQVLLRTVSRDERRRRRQLHSHGKSWRSEENAEAIGAKLVAAIIPKPTIVSGWALAFDGDTHRKQPGAKSTQLAVPAGAIYYFEADSAEEATKLAHALNWHGDTPGTSIRNRRSALLGEKGFGLGVCGSWDFHENTAAGTNGKL